jgi:hypothetical protein
MSAWLWRDSSSVKTFTFYSVWLLATLYIFFWLFERGVPLLPRGTLALQIHIMTGFIAAGLCVLNLLLTPASILWLRTTHRVLGWLTAAFLVSLFISGCVVLSERWHDLPIPALMAFAMGGLSQLMYFVLAVIFIRWRKDPVSHGICMLSVFFLGTLIPAVNRLPEFVPIPGLGVYWTFLSVVLSCAVFLAARFTRLGRRNLKNSASSSPEATIVESEDSCLERALVSSE